MDLIGMDLNISEILFLVQNQIRITFVGAIVLNQSAWSERCTSLRSSLPVNVYEVYGRFSMWPEAPSAVSQVPQWPTAPPRHPPPHTANLRPIRIRTRIRSPETK